MIDIGSIGHFIVVVGCSVDRHGLLRGGDAELAADQEPLVRDGGCCC